MLVITVRAHYKSYSNKIFKQEKLDLLFKQNRHKLVKPNFSYMKKPQSRLFGVIVELNWREFTLQFSVLPININCTLASLQAPILTTICLQNNVIMTFYAFAQAIFVVLTQMHSTIYFLHCYAWTLHRLMHTFMTTNLGFFNLF